MATIEERIDELLSKDITSLSSDQIISIITGQNTPQAYIDPQSEEGFNSEADKIGKDVDDLIKSLEPKDPPIPMKDIEKLSCDFEGDELYSKVLLESLKVKDKDLYKELLNSPDFINDKEIESSDIGIKTEINSLNKNKNLSGSKKGKSSNGITKFLNKKNPKLLESLNESLFDKIDPFIFGKPTNAGSKKKRELNILGFKVPLEFIMANGKILHVKLVGPDITIQQAEERVKKNLENQKKNLKECETKDTNEKEGNGGTGGTGSSNNPKVNVGGIIPSDYDSEKYRDYDLGFILDKKTGEVNEDPVIENDNCNVIPEDPVTGDPIVTKESIEGILDEFCDPDPSDLTGLDIGLNTGAGSGINSDQEKENEEVQVNPDFAEKQVNEIEGCLDSTITKYEKIDKRTLELARWKNIEKNLEEINYHYEIIWEYQKTLYEEWTNRLNANQIQNDSNLNLNLAISILTYTDIIRETEREVFFTTEEFNNSKKLFLENNKIFTENLFLLTIPDTEISSSELELLFNTKINEDLPLINYDQEKQVWPIQDGVNKFISLVEDIRFIIIKKNQIVLLNKKIEENTDLRSADIESLQNELRVPINIDDLEKAFKDASNWLPYSGGFTTERDYAQEIFQSSSSSNNNNNPYKGYGYEFKNSLSKFSVRFSNVQFDYQDVELKMRLSFFTDLGNSLPYKQKEKPNKISLKGTPQPIFKTVSEPDVERIKIGNEYAGNGGLLVNYPKDYFKGNRFLTVKNFKQGEKDIADFYDFINDIISTGKSKITIINEILIKRGILYARLIEKSASNWLFFTPEERGDNDARNPSNLRPASFTADGEPTPVFVDFWSNYKNKWNQKYLENKNLFITPEIERIKSEARRAGLAMGRTVNVDAIRGIRIIENYFDIQKKYEQIQELLLVSAQKIAEIEEALKPENVEKEFASISCGAGVDPNLSVECPPKCCGPAGSDFKTENFLLSTPPGSDCPSIFSKCWMKQFCKHLTLVGLLPYPNGLPPIENTAFFLGGGPSVRLGFKYWPVGYLPPAFIPLPVPNPVDGQPYIRIPLPMIWTIIDPIVIPLPLNLGTLIIFIPFIGGFMPTPLFFIKENVNGTSFFLTGLRGPRFIPRKSDPKINDPSEKIKQAISFGFPDKLVPLPGFGSDNIDSLPRILEDIKTNITKIMDNIPPPSNLESLRTLQDKELSIKNSISTKIKEYNKKAALLDDPEPNLDSERNQLNSIIAERKSVLAKVISNYISKGVPNPKTIKYPKDKDNLKIDIPGQVKSILDLAQQKSSLVPLKPPPTLDVKDYFKEILKNSKIPTPSEYDLENQNVSNDNRIIVKVNKDPKDMNEEEFKAFTKKVKQPCIEFTKYMVSGNGASIIKEKRKGAFSPLEFTQFQGNFQFPDPTVLDPPPGGLKFSKIPNPLVDQVTKVMTNGISSAPFKPSDFSKYVRSDENGNPITVLRVKDIKKIVSSKIGLSKKKAGETERPMDQINSLVTNFPFPAGPLASSDALGQAFGTAISLFEIPTAFPPKQDQISQTPLAGGLVQIAIPGAVIKQFLSKSVEELLKKGNGFDKYFPEINDPNSTKFTNLEPNDIQKMVRTMLEDFLNPDSPAIPDFLKITQIPILPKSRPTDVLEQILIGLGVPPPARIVYSLIWKYFKGLPKSPLPEEVTKPIFDAAAKILTKMPWPIVVLLGRNIVNIINPIAMSDDLPSWRRMSLKNVYYVVYLDEFLRSAADVSGLFKFFFGDPVYPIPELPSELQKSFNVKKY